METNPDQSTENSTADDAARPVEDPKPSLPVVTDITEIKSYADAKAVVIDGIDKLRHSSVDDIKKTGLRAVNRIYGAWRKLVDGD